MIITAIPPGLAELVVRIRRARWFTRLVWPDVEVRAVSSENPAFPTGFANGYLGCDGLCVHREMRSSYWRRIIRDMIGMKEN